MDEHNFANITHLIYAYTIDIGSRVVWRTNLGLRNTLQSLLQGESSVIT